MPRYRDRLPDDLKELIKLIRSGKLFAVQDWIAASKRYTLPEGNFTISPLQAALDTGFHSMVEILLRAGVEQEDMDDAIYRVVLDSRLDLVELLAAHGADPEIVDAETVIRSGNPPLIRWFVEHGMDLEEDCRGGALPLGAARYEARIGRGQIQALGHGHTRVYLRVACPDFDSVPRCTHQLVRLIQRRTERTRRMHRFAQNQLLDAESGASTASRQSTGRGGFIARKSATCLIIWSHDLRLPEATDLGRYIHAVSECLGGVWPHRGGTALAPGAQRLDLFVRHREAEKVASPGSLDRAARPGSSSSPAFRG
jgi:hypothetical protein